MANRRPALTPSLLACLTLCSAGALALSGCSTPAEASDSSSEAAVEAAAQVAEAPAAAKATTHPNDPRPSLAPMIERVSTAVVSVHAHGKPVGPGGLFGQQKGEASGSGFVLESDGIVVTNHHVVDGADRLEVRLQDGREFDAKSLGTDPATDLAVLQLEGASGLPTVELGSSSDLRVGDWVVAIGSPMGLEHSASVGILSGRGRGNLGLYADSYLDFLQTDADIAPGSSGGPLFDLDGRVVGINTAVGAGSGPGFAIPVDQAKAIVPQLRDQGEVVRGWLGAASAPQESDAPGGAVIGKVYAKTPASDAGLRPGDVVIDVDGNAIADFEALRRVIADSKPGHTILMTVRRGTETLELTAVLDERPDSEKLEDLRVQRRFDPTPPASKLPPPPSSTGGPRLGISARATSKGLEVLDVEPGSLADELDLQPGDVVTKLNGITVQEPADVVAGLEDETKIDIEIERGGTTQRITLQRS
jgi:serine protease Do